MNRSNIILLNCFVAVLLTACVPAVIGGGAVIGTSAFKEKGFSGTVSDTQLYLDVREAFFKQDPDLIQYINVSIQNGEAFLTGALRNDAERQKAIHITASVRGIKRVINKIGISPNLPVAENFNDAWITTKINSKLLFDGNVRSLNYQVKTISGVVQLTGIARNSDELSRVIDCARHTPGVKRVESYVRLKTDPFLNHK